MSGNGDDDNNFAWDDTVLVKSYEKSLNFSREELARRIAARTNTNANTSHAKEMPEKNEQENEIKSEAANTDGNVSVNVDSLLPSTYKVGDYARATYDVDGIDYEATITSIDEKSGLCSLCYIGYDNDQVVNLSDLVPSWGSEARRLQLLDAKRCITTVLDDNIAINDGGVSNKVPSTATFDHQSERKKHKSSKKAKQQQQQQHKYTMPNMENFSMLGMATPPPPLPPLFEDNIPDNSEHLSAMLMSWYMSGYYTGVYQGIQMAAKKTQKQQQEQNKDKVNK